VDAGYRPKDTHNWLGTIAWEEIEQRHQDDAAAVPRPRAGCGKQPVTYVSLREARLYCSWRGKRLVRHVAPHNAM